MKYVFHPEARLEYREAAVFYETRQTGLGARFTREIETTIERILETPERCRFVEQDVRRCLAHIFPYAIFYTVEVDFVLIVAVAHGSRRPGYWQDRLSGGTPGA
jgi:toxin ParE1/3/4